MFELFCIDNHRSKFPHSEMLTFEAAADMTVQQRARIVEQHRHCQRHRYRSSNCQSQQRAQNIDRPLYLARYGSVSLLFGYTNFVRKFWKKEGKPCRESVGLSGD